MSENAAGFALASPTPTPKRATASCVNVRASPDTVVMRLHTPRPLEITRVRVHVSAKRPSGSPKTA